MTSKSTDLSEDEAYDPWPGCIMDRTGCHGQSYYTKKYNINEQLVSFFNLDNKIGTITTFCPDGFYASFTHIKEHISFDVCNSQNFMAKYILLKEYRKQKLNKILC